MDCHKSPAEILREGVELLRERETKIAALDTLILRGIDSADADRVYGLDDVAAKLDARYANIAGWG